MSGFSHFPLQTAIYQVLSGDSGLMVLVSGIYDRPPQGSAYPYVTVGDAIVTNTSNIEIASTSQTVLISVWSREGGHKEAVTIMDRIYTLLNRANLIVTGQTLVDMEFSSSEVTLESDGWTYRGQMHFSAVLQVAD